MKPKQLKLRCYAEKQANQNWFAICVDLNLCAEGDSFHEARKKLLDIIYDYAEEACTIDKEHFSDLIPRKAPLNFVLKYKFYKFLADTKNLFFKAANHTKKIFGTILFSEVISP